MNSPTSEIFRKYTTPETFEKIVSYKSVSEMWEKVSAEYADSYAVNYNGQRYTYKQLADDVADFRAVLRNAGLVKGDRVALFSQNSYEFVVAAFAIMTSGMCAAILPAQLDEGSVFGCNMMFGTKALVFNPALEEKTVVAKAKGIKLISCCEKAGETAPSVDTDSKDGCVIMFTGGTTGKSKGALLSNGAVMQGTVNGCYGYNDVFGQKYILVLPLSHVFGFIRNLLTSVYTGSEILINVNKQDMFRDMMTFKPTVLVAVPALAEMALNITRQFGQQMLGGELKTVICGAAAVAPYLVKEYKALGIDLFPGYGLTESANLVSGNPESFDKPESVGLLYPNQEYRVENGELWLKGVNMMDGYLGVPEDPYEDGWFKTGDLVRFDDEGFMYITGRIKEIIVLANGENVSPAEVETYFNELAFVQDSQLFEDVDEAGHHFLSLEIVPRKAELDKIEAEDKGAYMMAELNRVNNSLLSYQRATKIVIRDSDFERTPSMKIARYHKV